MKKIYVVLLLLMFSKVSFAQLIVDFSSGVANTSSPTVDIDVTVENWNQLVSAQFSINWDPNVFEFNSIQNVTTVLEEFTQAGNIGTPTSAQAVQDGQLTVSWSLTSTLPTTIPDGTTLFTIRLNGVGDNCDETSLFISDIPRVTEIIDADLNDIGVTVGGGDLVIDDGTCTGNNMDCVQLTINNITGASGSNICIPVTADQFASIASLQTGITWNSSVLTFTGVNEVGLSGVSTNDAEAANGELRILWIIGLGDDPVTLADGSTLFELCFDVVGNTGQSTNISFEDLPNFSLEVANGDGAAEMVCTDNGRFQVSGTGGGNMNGVGLIGGNVATNGAMSICVPVTTRNFNSIASIQSGMSWDASILTYTGINDGAIEGITVNAANAGDGNLRLLWIIGLGEEPKTLADDAVLFEICFDVIGTNGQMSPVAFLSLPNFAIEIANGDGMSEEFFTSDGKVTIGSDGGGGNTDGVGLIAADVCTEGATSLCVPVTTKNFQSIASLQTGIGWDPAIISFTGVMDGALTGITVNDASASEGQLRLLWIIGLGDDPLTVADDEVLFELCFDAVGNDGDKSVVGFMDLQNFAIEIANGNGMSEDFFTDDGSACIGEMIDPGDCPAGLGSDLGIYAENVTVEEGAEVCVAIRVGNFTDIQSMQLTLQWDASIIEYVRQDNFGLTDLGNANFNFIAPNKLRVSWTPLSSAQSVDDCTTIFEVCFNGIGACDDMGSSPVQIVSDGNVLIEVTDANNNVLDVDIFAGSVTIEECMSDPDIAIQEISGVSCNGEEDGSVLTDVTGTGGASCEWTDSDGNVVSSDCNLSGVVAGTYTLTATNGLEMTSTEVVTIGSPDSIMVIIVVTNRDCDIESAFTISASGGTSSDGTYTYEYSGPVELENLDSHSAIPGGDYSVTIIDDNGCTLTESFVVLDSSIIVQAEVAGVSSIEGNDGGILLAATSTGGDLTYEWADGPTTPDRQGLSPGTYTVTVSDTTGCSSVRVYEIDWEAIFVDLIVDESIGRYNGFGISCLGDDNGMISGEIVGGCNDGPILLMINGQEATLPLTVSEGTYTLRATDACGNVDEQTIDISPPDPIEMGTYDPLDGCSQPGADNATVQLDLTGGVGDYLVTSSEGTVNGTLIEDLAPGFITVTVEDANGCQILIEDIEVIDCPGPIECEGATIISPNQDGINDVFVIGCLMRRGIEPNKLGVYNRWGELVFEQENYDNSWNGIDMNGIELDEGGYMWILKVSRVDMPVEVFRGTVTLLRSI